MGLKFWNFELQMLCVMNCKKITKCTGNQQCNRHLHFPGQHYSFQGFFQTFPYLWSFSRLFKALKISTLNSMTFHTFPGFVRTLSVGCNVRIHMSNVPEWMCHQLTYLSIVCSPFISQTEILVIWSSRWLCVLGLTQYCCLICQIKDEFSCGKSCASCGWISIVTCL